MKNYYLAAGLVLFAFSAGAQQWLVDPTPNPTQQCYLHGIKAINDHDIWAVGEVNNNGEVGGTPGFHGPLFIHWDGVSWTTVQNAQTWYYPDHNGTVYNDVDASASNDVWAVGQKFPDASAAALHFDGTSWATVDIPQAGWPEQLHGVKAFSANDVWLLGYGTQNISFSLHWNGSTWTKKNCDPSSSGGEQYSLLGIDGVSSNDLWAAGLIQPPGSPASALIEHYNGTSWTIIPSPNSGSYLSRLSSVYVAAADDVYFAGIYSDDFGSTYKNLILHWNGSAMSQIDVPGEGAAYNYMYDITGSSGNNIWTAGIMVDTTIGEFSTSILHFDGTSWDIVGSPDPNPYSNRLQSVTVLPDGKAWAAGYQDRAFFFTPDDLYYTLVERFDTGALNTASTDKNDSRFKVYPNPFSGSLRIAGTIGSSVTFRLSDVSGKMVYDEQLDIAEDTVMRLDNLASGMYYFSIEDHGNITNGKVVKY